MPLIRFLDRADELENLQTFSRLEEPSLALIYGRRRIGKSRLLQEFANDRDVYFLADKQNPILQRERLAADASRLLKGIEQAHYPSWESLICQIDWRMPKGACLILDEFPYLVGLSPELPSVIQRLLDTDSLKNLHLILCGSSQRMMLNLAMGAREPLYGRCRLILKIRPLECGWMRKALSFDHQSAVEAYSILGGTPRYWELARSHDTIEAIIKEMILDRNGILHNETRRLLLDDLKDSSLAISLLSLIGNGCHRLSELAGRMGKPATHLTRPMAHLVELGYIRRETPFGENERKSRRSLYKIDDPFLRFIFRYLEPNRSRLALGATHQVYLEVQRKFPHHVGTIWEDLARASTSRMTISGKEWQPAKRWWRGSRDREIDIVCQSLDGESVLVGEVKWSRVINTEQILNRLKESAGQLPSDKRRKVKYALWQKGRKGSHGELSCIHPSRVLDAFS